MSWKPRHEAHAIERVRLMFAFREPLTSKVLQTASTDIVGAAGDLGFDTVQPAESSILGVQLNLQQGGVPHKLKGQKNGTVLKRHSEGRLIEEAGFRDNVFGYVTTTYGRWENLLERLESVMLPPLALLGGLADLQSIKLEYWDSFTFEGPPEEADATQILTEFDARIPEEVVHGASQWHSHVGWFENKDGYPILINRNIDVADRNIEDGIIRALGIYTLVELRSDEQDIDITNLQDTLGDLHRRSLLLFGETLSEDYRKMIGLDLDEYK